MEIEKFPFAKFLDGVIRDMLEIEDVDAISVCAVDKKGDIHSWQCDMDSFKLGQIISGLNKDVFILMMHENREVFKRLLEVGEDDD